MSECRRYEGRFALNVKIKSAIIFLRTDSDVRSLNTTIAEGPVEHHKPRLASRETSDGLTGTYIQWGNLGPDRIGAKMVATAACECRPEGSPWTGQSRALVKP